MKSNYDTIDRVAMIVSGGLMLLGIVVLGLVETFAGKPYGASPMTNEAGDIVATPLVDPALRTGFVLMGLMILLLWGVYRFTASYSEEEDAATSDVTAD